MQKGQKALWIIAVLIVASCLILISCGQSKTSDNKPQEKGEEPQSTQNLSLATAATGGGWYAGGVAIAELLSKEVDGLKVTAEETGGGVENVRLLSNGSVDMAFINADVAIAARTGNEPFKASENLLANAQVAWQLFDNQIHIVAKASSGIKKIADLKGKSFNIGPPGSAGNQLGEEILKAHGLTIKDVSPVYLPWNEAADALIDGKVDVAILAGGVPAPAVESLIAREPINFVQIASSSYDGFRKNGLYITSIPANTYKDQSEPVDLLTWRPYVFIRQELDEDLVFNITKTVMDNTEELAKIYKPSNEITVPGKEIVEEIGFQLHPGTLRYLSTMKS